MENTQVGPFKIIQRLGTNRRQRVFQARQVEQNKDVVLKFIKLPPDVAWESALNKIEREVEILKRLKHPNLVQVYGAGVHEEQVFFATELVKSESLTSVLSRRGKLAHDLAVEYGRQIALMLEYIHGEEILHAKLTPDKILITPDHHVKVSDLRLNRSRKRRWDDGVRRRELDIAAYMAPEQFTEGATTKSDFYALGVLMFEMLTGVLPYAPDTMGRMTQKKMNSPVPSVSDHVMNCPIWLENLIKQLLDPSPRKRPYTAKAIVFAFDELKNIDKTKKAAVSQVTGGFNPLTVGTDKSEAKRLLGKKTKREKKKERETPIYESIPFLAGALVLIAVIIGFALVPPSPEKMMSRADKLMESDKASSWRKARTMYQTIMEDENLPESMRDEAEDLYYETRRRTLVLQAENGTVLRFQDRESQMFGNAVSAEMSGEFDRARELYTELVERLKPDGEKRHILVESKSRLKELLSKDDELPKEPAQLLALIEGLGKSPDEIAEARKRLSQIVLVYSGEDGFDEVVGLAQSRLRELESTATADETGDAQNSDKNNEGVDEESGNSEGGSDRQRVGGEGDEGDKPGLENSKQGESKPQESKAQETKAQESKALETKAQESSGKESDDGTV